MNDFTPAYLLWDPMTADELQTRSTAEARADFGEEAWAKVGKYILAGWDGVSALREWQDDRCAICARRGWLVVDHDHVTALVRGLLCQSCNTLEGNGSPGSAFTAYRARPPAAVIGVREVYVSPITGPALPSP